MTASCYLFIPGVRMITSLFLEFIYHNLYSYYYYFFLLRRLILVRRSDKQIARKASTIKSSSLCEKIKDGYRGGLQGWEHPKGMMTTKNSRSAGT
jgi:hypothetical protein